MADTLSNIDQIFNVCLDPVQLDINGFVSILFSSCDMFVLRKQHFPRPDIPVHIVDACPNVEY